MLDIDPNIYYRGLQVAWHKNRDEIGACAKFGGNFELEFRACADFVAIFVPSNLYRVFQVRCHKKATRIGACAHFGGNFEWGITRMRGFSSLFCDNGPEKPCIFKNSH